MSADRAPATGTVMIHPTKILRIMGHETAARPPPLTMPTAMTAPTKHCVDDTGMAKNDASSTCSCASVSAREGARAGGGVMYEHLQWYECT
jgi:hypothetical protein